ncbi:helix-turn-helix transcriptional regulator [Amycolatopsis sp. NPDC059090]|uniref:helix-turn-helix domain-containing protein n=1 Tax=Amycolatopsis sp. NPDC059090 TaxID=3346723 RepID=UPI00366E61D7
MGALKRLREQAGLTLAEAGKAAGFSEAKVSRIETFAVQLSGDDAYALAIALGADEDTANSLVILARSAKKRDWWHDAYQDKGIGRFTDFLELEDDARHLFGFQQTLIPGRLQTRAYAEAVIRTGLPDAEDEEIERRVQLRMDRQKRNSVPFWTVIDESVLWRPMGDRAVMAEQLDHLAAAAGKPGTTVQIIPQSATGYPPISTSFMVLVLNDGAVFAYLDTLTGGLFVEAPEEVEAYEAARSRLQAVALDFDASAKLVRQARDEHRRT